MTDGQPKTGLLFSSRCVAGKLVEYGWNEPVGSDAAGWMHCNSARDRSKQLLCFIINTVSVFHGISKEK